jgi:hypothetical protein
VGVGRGWVEGERMKREDKKKRKSGKEEKSGNTAVPRVEGRAATVTKSSSSCWGGGGARHNKRASVRKAIPAFPKLAPGCAKWQILTTGPRPCTFVALPQRTRPCSRATPEGRTHTQTRPEADQSRTRAAGASSPGAILE